MIEKNWRAILLSLLAANLVFMALLELQRRTIWQNEREHLTRIEKLITTTEKKQAGYDVIQDQLAAISKQLIGLNERVNNVEIKTLELPASIAITRDIQARVTALETTLRQMPAAKQ
jgi:hypothetical protein